MLKKLIIMRNDSNEEEKDRKARRNKDSKILKKKIEKNDCKNETQKMTCAKFIPKQVAKPDNLYFLRGGILVDLNIDNDDSKISNMNFVTQLRSCTIERSQKVVYTEFQPGGVDFDSHEQVILTLSQYADFEMNQLAEALKKHEVKIFQDAVIKQQVLQMIDSNFFVQHSFNIKEKEFQEFRESVIKSLPKDKIFHFVDFGFDSNGMSMKVLGEGFNDKFCNLMGCDIDTFQDISLRKGILEFKQANMKIKLLRKIIEMILEGGSQRCISGDIGIITLDDILIDCQYNADFYISPSYNVLKSFFHPQYTNSLFDRGFAVIELILTDFHIHKINTIRTKYQHEATTLFNQRFVEHKQSIYESTDMEPQDLIYQNLHHQTPKYDSISDNSLSQDQILNNLPQQNNNLYPMSFTEAIQNTSESSQNLQAQSYQNYQLNSSYFEQFSSPSQPIQTISKSYNSAVQNLQADIPHQIQSQCFLERFYSPISSQQNQKQLKIPGRCGFRVITQEQWNN